VSRTHTREVELKLSGAPDALARLGDHAAARLDGGAAPITPAEVRTVEVRTVYYDTPQLELAAAGVSVRLRRDGDRRLLTLKTRGDAGTEQGAAATRREWETPLDDDHFDPALLDRFDGAGLVPPELRAALRPCFTTMISRRTLRLAPADGVMIEMSIDHGEALTEHASEPVSEVELELKQGPPAALFRLALDLHAHTPLRLEGESKADVGLRLLTGRAPQAVAPPPLGLSRLLTAGEALRHGQRGAVACLIANLSAVRHGDAGAVAQMRAGLRRLRWALRPLPRLSADDDLQALSSESRRLGARAAPVIAWNGLFERLRADDAPRKLLTAAAGMRDDAMSDAVAALNDPCFTAWLLALAARMEDESRPVLPAALPEAPAALLWGARLEHLARRCAGPLKRLATGDLSAAAKLRRRLRRLTEAAEAGRGLYPPAATQAFIDALSAPTDALENHRAAAVRRRLLRALATEHPQIRAAARRQAKIFRREEEQALLSARLLSQTTVIAPYWRDSEAEKLKS
jgi:triphosphatase